MAVVIRYVRSDLAKQSAAVGTVLLSSQTAALVETWMSASGAAAAVTISAVTRLAPSNAPADRATDFKRMESLAPQSTTALSTTATVRTSV